MEYLQNLANELNHPDIPWKTIIVGFSLSQYVLETFLQLRQHKVLQGDKIPSALSQDVSKETFDKSQAYGRAKSKFGFFKEFYGIIQVLGIIYFDLLVKFWDMSGEVLPHLPEAFRGEKTQSVIFFMIFNFISTALNLPTSYWHTFVLEEKFGFNKQTKGLFFTDLVKSQALTAVIGIPCIAAFLKIIEATGDKFFYYLFIFVVFLQAFMITVYPIFILPLFNKLSPLEEGKLKTETEALAARLKFPLKSLFVIDGSKRSAHSNAYFYGLPWSKHIVIYDTLLEKSEVSEVVAVLAHELGHWSLSHTTKLLLIGQAHMFAIFTLFSVFIHNNSLYEAFGFTKVHPILIGLILFNDLLQPIDTFLKLGMNIVSRKFEFEADAFAVKLGYSTDLARSLINLQIENLSTMDSDWMYAAYHFSHPILPERLGALGWKPAKAQE